MFTAGLGLKGPPGGFCPEISNDQRAITAAANDPHNFEFATEWFRSNGSSERGFR